MNDYSALKVLLRADEGDIAHLYLDSKGYVTTAVGHKIVSCAAAIAIDGWIDRVSHQPATKQQIEADWAAVNRAQPNLAAERYAAFTRLELPEYRRDELLTSDIAEKETELRRAFPAYYGFPASAKEALLDMAFNLGVNGLVMKFPHFLVAARAEPPDWTACAAQCRRAAPVSAERNARVRALFLEAQSVLA